MVRFFPWFSFSRVNGCTLVALASFISSREVGAGGESAAAGTVGMRFGGAELEEGVALGAAAVSFGALFGSVVWSIFV